jgi:hypothetical protein
MMAHEDDPRFCDDPAYFWTMCSKLGATQQARKFPWKQRFEGEISSVRNEKDAGCRESRAGGR